MMQKSAIRVATGSDAFILSTADNHKRLAIENHDLKEFRLTLTITWEEFRDPAQAPGSLWLGYSLAKNTPALNGIGTSVPIPVRVAPKPENLEIKTFLIVTLGEITVHYTGQAKAHIWLSFFAEYVD